MGGIPELPARDTGQSESGSLSGQKRPRDYGEELKGLPSDDEGGQSHTLSSASKKQKMNHPDDDNSSGLDDGEIVESGSDHDSANPTHEQHISKANAAIHSTTHELSEDGEIDDSITAEEPPKSSELDAPFFIDKSGSKSTQHAGWNQGLSLGARTSFAKPAANLFPANPSGKPESKPESDEDEDDNADEDTDTNTDEDEDENETRDDGKKPDGQRESDVPKSGRSKPGHSFRVGEDTWDFPKVTFRTKDKIAKSMFLATDDGRLFTWVEALLKANPEMADSLTPDIVRQGFDEHLKHPRAKLLSGNTKNRRMAANNARRAIQEADLTSYIAKARKLSKQRTKAPQGKVKNETPKEREPAVASGSSRNGETHEHAALSSAQEEEPDESEELQLQERYFPGAQDPSRYCLSCSGIGHRARECPQLRCKFCTSQQHTMFACPSRQRCLKCRQLGHRSESCQEKLSLAPGEQGGCAICSAGHPEEICTEIWRSFLPFTELHKKVKDIPSFCYTCGSIGHFGPECGLPDRGAKVTGSTTWSQDNRLRYVDPNSEDIAIAWVGVSPVLAQGGHFQIRGIAKRQVHTHFVSDDESEEDLVHAPVKKQEPRGGIRIASNIGSIGRGGSNNGQRLRVSNQSRPNNTNFAPPLPPGPPPPMNNRSRRSQAPPPPASLPPRPQNYNNYDSGKGGNSNNHSQNGRGGRGGRGRGGRGGDRGGRGGGGGRGRR
ncbi:hypothetical protein M426DRAFT_7252 [Hypoxylon sp. CI-4A]|nr:hypothetical protein M426DRAFT_7252 [Hypoxylon sp. CI-4A]